MTAESGPSKILEVAKNIAIGAGIIVLAFAAADVALLKTGLLMTSGV
jgi:hypothetical protein